MFGRLFYNDYYVSYSKEFVRSYMDYETDILYANDSGFMPPYGENGVLFTTEYVFLRNLTKRSTNAFSSVGMEAIKTTLAPSDVDKLSHDNMTAIVCLSKHYGFEFHKHYFHREWWWRLHPRDIFFYLYMKGGVARLFSFFGIWITVISMVVSALSTQKVANGDLDTDSKILAWLRCEAAGWFKLGLLIKYIIKKRNNASLYDIFNVYFRKDKSNPIMKLAKEVLND